jgi:hypothetical protein
MFFLSPAYRTEVVRLGNADCGLRICGIETNAHSAIRIPQSAFSCMLFGMRTFTEREFKLVQKLKQSPAQTVLKIAEACPLHSYCNPLPLFRLYKIDDLSPKMNPSPGKGTPAHLLIPDFGMRMSDLIPNSGIC